MYGSQWLFTFFAIDMPFDFVFICIDLFLVEGFAALIRTILALLTHIEGKNKCFNNKLKYIETVIDMDFEDMLVYIKTFARKGEHNTDV